MCLPCTHSFKCPIQDPRQFSTQFVGKLLILTSFKVLCEWHQLDTSPNAAICAADNRLMVHGKPYLELRLVGEEFAIQKAARNSILSGDCLDSCLSKSSIFFCLNDSHESLAFECG